MTKKKMVRIGKSAKRGTHPRAKAVLVKVHPEEKARLDAVAKHLDLSRPASIRMLIDAEYYRIKLPGATLPEQAVSTPA